MIVDRNGQIFMIKQKDYLDGIKFKDVNNSIELDESTGFCNKVFAAVYNISFDNKKKLMDCLNLGFKVQDLCLIQLKSGKFCLAIKVRLTGQRKRLPD